jgi:hypothetical protein
MFPSKNFLGDKGPAVFFKPIPHTIGGLFALPGQFGVKCQRIPLPIQARMDFESPVSEYHRLSVGLDLKGKRIRLSFKNQDSFQAKERLLV